MRLPHQRQGLVIVNADTADELVMQRRNSKREVQDTLLEAMKKKSLK